VLPQGPVVARDCPQVAGLGLSSPRIEHRTSCLVGEQFARRLQDRDEPVVDGPELEGREPDPVGERRAIDLDPLGGQHLRLAIEREMPGILRHDHVDDQCLGRQAAFDQPRWRRGLDHAGRLIGAGLLARATGVLWSPRHDDFEPGRNLVEPFGRSSPITCRSPPQQGQTLLPGSITTSSRGRCAGR
jgi:hypothetical protein